MTKDGRSFKRRRGAPLERMTLTVSEPVLATLDAHCEKHQKSRSRVVEDLLAWYFKKLGTLTST